MITKVWLIYTTNQNVAMNMIKLENGFPKSLHNLTQKLPLMMYKRFLSSIQLNLVWRIYSASVCTCRFIQKTHVYLIKSKWQATGKTH